MGTHPIFESDFDCLTDKFRIFLVVYLNQLLATLSPSIWSKGIDKHGRPPTSRRPQSCCTGMRGHGDILMGKNTMMKKVIRECAASNPAMEKLLPLVKQNIGFVMTNGDLKEIRDLIEG